MINRKQVQTLTGALTILSGCLLTSPASAQLTWTGGSGDYNTGSNWSGGTAPTSTDNVIFNANETATVSFAGAASSADIFFQQGNYTFDLGVQTWTGNGGVLRFGDGNTAAWTSDTILSGGTLNFDGYLQAGVFVNDDDSSLTLTNGHTMNLNQASTIDSVIGREGSNTALNVESGSTLNVRSLIMATNSGSSGNSVVADGAGSTINIGASGGGNTRIGGTLAGSDNNTFTVQNGASVTQNTANVVVGTSNSTDRLGSGNKLVVTGAGSMFTSDTSLLTVRGGTGAGASGNSVEVTNGGTLDLTASGANLEIRHENTLLVDGGTINLNSGTLKLLHAGSLLDFNSGTINVQATASSATTRTVIGDGIGGSADATYNAVAGGSTHNFISGGGLLVETDGAITGTGLFIGDIEVSGRLAPGSAAAIGTLTLQEDLTLNASAVTRIKVNGFGAGEFDLIEEFGTSTATLGGTLLLEFASGFDTIGGSTIIDFTTIAGDFDTVQSSGLASGFSASFDSLTSNVSVIPEPGSFALIGGFLALGAIALRRRR